MKKILLLTTYCLSIGVLSAQVIDGGFEAGVGGGAWTEASTVFGTPLCDLASCGNGGGGSVPASGAWFAWFGGAGGSVETGSVEQSITIPSGATAALTIQVKISAAGPGLVADRLDVSVDGNVLATVTAHDSVMYQNYTPLVVNVSAMADGGSHTIRLEGYQTTTSTFSILADDVVLSVDGGVIGLFDFEETSTVAIYPNPAQEEINLNFGALKGSASISIISVDGAVVSQHEVNDVFGKTVSFNTADLNNGVYIVQIVNNGNVSTERIVISK